MEIRLRVQGGDGRAQSVLVEAVSEAEAIRKAVASGARVLAVEPSSDSSESTQSQRAGSFPLLLFSQELLALLEAGLNLTEALATLHAKEQRPAARLTLGAILKALHEGRNFSDTLSLYPQHFPDVYVATVRASERTGSLPEALARFIGYQVQFDTIKKKLVSTAIYPVMLLVVGGFVTLFLLGYVVPKFSVVYESAGRDMPWLSRLLLAFGQLLYQHWPWFLAGFTGLIGTAIYVLVNEAWRKRWLEEVLRLPFLARKTAEFRLARFYRAVGLLLYAGIPLTKSLAMVAGLLTSAQQAQLAAAKREVEEGLTFSSALVAHGLASPVAVSLIKVGESTGRLADMMERTAKFHDEDFARWVDWASRLLEPILMTAIGVVIGTIVVLMYMPIFDLAGSLQ